MRPLTSTELLHIWENGFGQPNIEKACSILTAASPSANMEVVKKWSIEERDIKLFYLRYWMFGDRFINTANCPQCNEQVEWEMNIEKFSIPPLPLNKEAEFHFSTDDYKILYRLPNSEDLHLTDSEQILCNCLLEIKKQDKPVSLQKLPETIIESLGKEMEIVSPLSNISLGLNCPECRHQWEMNFDILTYLWKEIDSWAMKILEEVYLLANAFKWSEKDILNMSNRRRRIYLNMIQA